MKPDRSSDTFFSAFMNFQSVNSYTTFKSLWQQVSAQKLVALYNV